MAPTFSLIDSTISNSSNIQCKRSLPSTLSPLQHQSSIFTDKFKAIFCAIIVWLLHVDIQRSENSMASALHIFSAHYHHRNRFGHDECIVCNSLDPSKHFSCMSLSDHTRSITHLRLYSFHLKKTSYNNIEWKMIIHPSMHLAMIWDFENSDQLTYMRFCTSRWSLSGRVSCYESRSGDIEYYGARKPINCARKVRCHWEGGGKGIMSD